MRPDSRWQDEPAPAPRPRPGPRVVQGWPAHTQASGPAPRPRPHAGPRVVPVQMPMPFATRQRRSRLALPAAADVGQAQPPMPAEASEMVSPPVEATASDDQPAQPAAGPQPRPRPASTTAERSKAAILAKARTTKSKLAKPLLTSMGAVTFLATGCFVVLAVASTGSVAPWDWTRTDPSLAASRYQACARQGLGAIGCMLSAGFHPASAAAAAREQDQPLFSVATIQDTMPSAAPSHAPTSKPPARNVPAGVARPGYGVGTNPGGPGPGPGGPDPTPRPSPRPSPSPGGPSPTPGGPTPTPDPGP